MMREIGRSTKSKRLNTLSRSDVQQDIYKYILIIIIVNIFTKK